MNGRRKFDVNALASLLLIVGVLVLINLISLRFFSRLDLTDGKIYTLSTASRKVIGSLDDRLTVKAFFSKDLPPPYNNTARYLKDQLDEYKAYSRGNLHYEFVDPATEEALEQEAQSFRIPPVQVNAIENDRIEIKRVYMGLVLLYEDRSETIPIVQNTIGLEYDLTCVIKRVASREIKTVGFTTGHDEPDLFKDLKTLRTTLEKTYHIESVDLKNDLVPEDVDVLVVLAPQKALSDWEKFAVDQFVMGGGKVAFLVNKIKTEIEESYAERLDLGLDDWLGRYGVKINDDLVVDLENTLVQVQQQQGFVTITNTINYPFFPEVTRFDRQHVLVKDLENLSFSFPSSLDTSLASDQGVHVTAIAWTSERSGVQTGNFNINPFQRLSASLFNRKHLILATTVKGTFSSFFAEAEVPMKADSTREEIEVIRESPENRMVVMGDGNFVRDKFLGNKSNLTFFLNVVDWLAQDEELIAIRTREVTSRPLAEISEGGKKWIKYFNVLGAPMLVIFFGVVRWQIRRAKKKAREFS